MLTVLVVLQSGFAVAFSYEPHQSNSEHYQSKHSHEVQMKSGGSGGNTETAAPDTNLEHPADDCHECGHCHGHASAAIVATQLPGSSTLSETSINYLSRQINYQPIALFRPPIA
ncbi:hypothetical protein [Paraferrimonas haliotis]|uniref:DUF2946 domain-containing protein n=2 Tax=Paraferrimonas haliotis TaxID=2013866 RepID=A0AA37TYQ3_9GAMM|nr:hypothetical protein [Paraferrimonas haliotis]GLS83756.1 hypothetical protein GCM10007894_17330 [Paraferrimonas haliotis]